MSDAILTPELDSALDWALDRALRDCVDRIGTARSISKYRGQQQHTSWQITTDAGKFWIKIQLGECSYAGIAREAHILRALGGRAPYVPSLVSYRRLAPETHCIVTEHVDGDALSADPQSVLGVAKLAADLHRLPVHESIPTYPAGPHSLFSPNCSPSRCLRWVHHTHPCDDRLNRVVDGLSPRVADEANPAVIHGSLDPWNVVLSADGIVLLDWEACRVGHPGWDQSSLIFGAVSTGQTAIAASLLSQFPEALGFILIRALYLHSNKRETGELAGFLESYYAIA